jgi:hypothetical protein
VNFLFGGLALDPGNFYELPWYKQLAGFEWGVLHAPGIIAADWISRTGLTGYDGPIVLIAGYLATVALIAVCLEAASRVRARMNQPGEKST